METVYDWVTVGIFAALVVLFMQRSTGDELQRDEDSLLLYLAAGGGCAAANYFGNQEQHVVAVLLIGRFLYRRWRASASSHTTTPTKL